MKKKTRFKSKGKALARDFLIAATCLSVFAGSLWLFWNDLNKFSTRSDKDAIATITFKYKVAQRKFTDRVVWERLQQNSPLYDEDTIKTSDMSSATITFNGGEVLSVHENTMVQIFKSSDGSVRLSVGDGGVEVDTSESKASSMAIEMKDGSLVNLEAGSRLSATSRADGESNIQLQSGSGVVAGEVPLSAGQTVKVENGRVQKVPLSVTSISNDLLILNNEKTPAPVHLEWVAEEASSSGRFVVQTSRSKDFDKIESEIEVQNLNYADIPVTEGNVYWRVFEEHDPEKVVSGKIRMSNLIPPELSTPGDNATYKYRKTLPQIPFSWEESQFAQYYRLEVSSTPDFYSTEISKDIQGLNYVASELEEGTYFWRVIPYYSLNNTGFKGSSKVAGFTIRKAEILTNPVTVSPADKANLFYVTDNLNTSFRWQSEDVDAEYEFVLSDTEDFSSITYSDFTRQNRIQKDFTPATLPAGTYYWKVCRQALPDEGLEKEWSDVKSFNVAFYSPKKTRIVYPPDNFYTDSENLVLTDFSWKAGDEVDLKKVDESTGLQSVIQFSKTQDFSNVVMEKTTSENQIDNISLEGGKYFWRVGLRETPSSELHFTQVQSLTVLKELEPVNVTSPLASQSVLVSQVRPLRVGWKTCPDADYYVVKLLNRADGSLLQEKSFVKENFAVFNTDDLLKAPSMELTCSVQPVANATEYAAVRTGKESSVDFAIRQPEPVKLLLPAAESKIAGLDALRTPVVFNWQEGRDIPQRSQFVIQKLQSGGSYRDFHVIENPAKEINLEGLTAGTYRWIVKASLADGTPVNAADYKYITVLPVPELDKPVLLEPENGFVMNAGFLKKNRTLKFRWQEVPDATDYTFSIYKKGGDGRLLHVSTIKTGKTTGVNFRELKLLDVGQFEWQVTAYSINKKGFEEQHSKAASGSFVIDIRLPKSVNVKNPGEIFIE